MECWFWTEASWFPSALASHDRGSSKQSKRSLLTPGVCEINVQLHCAGLFNAVPPFDPPCTMLCNCQRRLDKIGHFFRNSRRSTNSFPTLYLGVKGGPLQALRKPVGHGFRKHRVWLQWCRSCQNGAPRALHFELLSPTRPKRTTRWQTTDPSHWQSSREYED